MKIAILRMMILRYLKSLFSLEFIMKKGLLWKKIWERANK